MFLSIWLLSCTQSRCQHFKTWTQLCAVGGGGGIGAGGGLTHNCVCLCNDECSARQRVICCTHTNYQTFVSVMMNSFIRCLTFQLNCSCWCSCLRISLGALERQISKWYRGPFLLVSRDGVLAVDSNHTKLTPSLPNSLYCR